MQQNAKQFDRRASTGVTVGELRQQRELLGPMVACPAPKMGTPERYPCCQIQRLQNGTSTIGSLYGALPGYRTTGVRAAASFTWEWLSDLQTPRNLMMIPVLITGQCCEIGARSENPKLPGYKNQPAAAHACGCRVPSGNCHESQRLGI
eukprot:1106475-Rhodomonas_salina.2